MKWTLITGPYSYATEPEQIMSFFVLEIYHELTGFIQKTQLA